MRRAATDGWTTTRHAHTQGGSNRRRQHHQDRRCARPRPRCNGTPRTTRTVEHASWARAGLNGPRWRPRPVLYPTHTPWAPMDAHTVWFVELAARVDCQLGGLHTVTPRCTVAQHLATKDASRRQPASGVSRGAATFRRARPFRHPLTVLKRILCIAPCQSIQSPCTNGEWTLRRFLSCPSQSPWRRATHCPTHAAPFKKNNRMPTPPPPKQRGRAPSRAIHPPPHPPLNRRYEGCAAPRLYG